LLGTSKKNYIKSVADVPYDTNYATTFTSVWISWELILVNVDISLLDDVLFCYFLFCSCQRNIMFDGFLALNSILFCSLTALEKA